MNSQVDTIEYKGYNIEIYYDNDPLNPREEFDTLGKMICFHNKYNLGDKRKEWYEKEPHYFEMWLKELKGKYVILPLYLYDHSGITMNTTGFSCPWDSGQVGYIYVTYDKIEAEYGWKVMTKKRIEKIKEYLRGEVETYDQFLTGNVYCFVTKDENNEELGSCGGFFGYKWEENGLLDHAKGYIDYYLKENKKKQNIIDSVTSV